jgi:hypothetical protein
MEESCRKQSHLWSEVVKAPTRPLWEGLVAAEGSCDAQMLQVQEDQALFLRSRQLSTYQFYQFQQLFATFAL